MVEVRPPQEHELPEISELLNDVFRRPRGIFDQVMIRDFPLVFTPENRPNCRILLDSGRIVSHAGLWTRELIFRGQRLKVGMLASVATHPDCRGRGFAAQVVGSILRQMQEQEYDLGVLWTAVPEFYLKLDWQLVRPSGLKAMFSAPRLASVPTDGIKVQAYEAGQHLQSIVELHEREPIRIARTPEEYATLLTLPKVDTWVALEAGRVAAYVAHGRACNKQGIVEYGGSLSGIAAIAHHIASRLPADAETPLLAYHVRPDLIEWIRQVGLPSEPLTSSKGMANEMIRPFRPERLPVTLRDDLFIWGLEHV